MGGWEWVEYKRGWRWRRRETGGWEVGRWEAETREDAKRKRKAEEMGSVEEESRTRVSESWSTCWYLLCISVRQYTIQHKCRYMSDIISTTRKIFRDDKNGARQPLQYPVHTQHVHAYVLYKYVRTSISHSLSEWSQEQEYILLLASPPHTCSPLTDCVWARRVKADFNSLITISCDRGQLLAWVLDRVGSQN